MFLYKKDNIIAKKKLSINGNANQTVLHQSKKAKILVNLLLDLVLDILLIQDDLNIAILEEAF